MELLKIAKRFCLFLFLFSLMNPDLIRLPQVSGNFLHRQPTHTPAAFDSHSLVICFEVSPSPKLSVQVNLTCL